MKFIDWVLLHKHELVNLYVLACAILGVFQRPKEVRLQALWDLLGRLSFITWRDAPNSVKVPTWPQPEHVPPAFPRPGRDQDPCDLPAPARPEPDQNPCEPPFGPSASLRPEPDQRPCEPSPPPEVPPRPERDHAQREPPTPPRPERDQNPCEPLSASLRPKRDQRPREPPPPPEAPPRPERELEVADTAPLFRAPPARRPQVHRG